MDSVGSTSDTQITTSSLAANILSSLNASLGADAAGTQLFSQFLAQTKNMNVPLQSSTINAVTRNVPQENTPNATMPAPSLPALKKLVTVLHRIMQKLQTAQNGNNTQKKPLSANERITGDPGAMVGKGKTASKSKTQDPTTANQSAPPPAPGPAQNTNTALGNSADPTDPSTVASAAGQAVVAASVGATNDPPASTTNAGGNDPTAALDPLAKLQQLMQMLERELQAAMLASGTAGTTPSQTAAATATPGTDASTAGTPLDTTTSAAQANSLINSQINAALLNGGADTSANGTDSTTPSTPLTAAQVLVNLLTLTQTIEKKLETVLATNSASATDPTTQTSSAATTSSSTAPSSLLAVDPQLDADLKTLLRALQSTLIASDKQSDSSSSAATNSNTNSSADASIAATTSSSATSAANTPINVSSPSSDFTQKALNDGFFGLFGADSNNGSTDPTTATNLSFAPVIATGAATGAGDKSGTSLDLDLDQQGQNASSTANGTASTATDNSTLAAMAEGAKSTDPYNFASQLSETRAANGGATGLPSAVEQVILQINRNVKNGNDQMTLQLQPADLGRINIKLDFSSDGKVQGTVVADNPATLNLLLKDVRSLERALQDAGLRADPGSLQFSLGGQSGQTGNSSGQTANSYLPNTSSGSNSGTAQDLTTDLSALPTDASEIYYLTPGRVNLRV